MSAVLVPTISEQAWLDARRPGITSSDIPVLLGLVPGVTPEDLYEAKRGQAADPPDLEAIAVERAIENFIADQFSRACPNYRMTGAGRELYRHQTRIWQMATPTRVVYNWQPPHGPAAVLACALIDVDGFGDDSIPARYGVQVLWQMDVLGVDDGYLAALHWPSRRLHFYDLSLDADARHDMLLLRHAAALFHSRVLLGDPGPAPDWAAGYASLLRTVRPPSTAAVADDVACPPAGVHCTACGTTRGCDADA